MDVFDAIKKRRMCREFKPDPVPRELLDKLLYAARRAPTGGNTPFRRLLMVEDPRVLRMMKKVAPGYLGASPAALVIITDLTDAYEGLGPLGRDTVATFDAGASAENVALAAVSMGLAVCFIKSYPEAAMKEVLGLPDHFRTEIVVAIGYPRPKLTSAPTPRKGADRVYWNQYAEEGAP